MPSPLLLPRPLLLLLPLRPRPTRRSNFSLRAELKGQGNLPFVFLWADYVGSVVATNPYSRPIVLKLSIIMGKSLRRRVVGLILGFFATAPLLAANLIELTAGFYRIEAEVANTDESRQIGLMHRQKMALNHGMLFVFDQPARHCMWMKNTLLPLSVAFLDDQGRIVNIEDMQPQTEDNHCAAQPAKYALEMNLGWFAGRGLGPGVTLGAIDRAPPARR
jgi:uncharacterized membrane protein (UPF0127 family)